jgi:hypothetical protein
VSQDAGRVANKQYPIIFVRQRLDLTLIKLLILLMRGRLTCGFAVRVG